MRKILLITLMLVASLSATAKNAVLNGMLVSASDTLPLVSATVKLLKANKDSTFVKGGVTDEEGVFNIKAAPGNYVLKFVYLGFNDVTRRVTIENDGRDVNLGVIPMAPSDGVMLEGAVVVGVRTPIVVKEDTVEYTAETYKTQTNAVLEDILKRMPGVEVGTDGKITANGKTVKKILVDGKEFFSDDPTVASKNLPADMIDKLQIIDRKSELARLMGVDDGDDETVINLTIKKDMNNGWFGNANAGYGTGDHYIGNIIANYFNNGDQITFMGGGNNTNNLGFTDDGSSRFTRYNGSSGIVSSQHMGLNFNVGSKGKDKEKFRAGGDLMYSHSDRKSITSRDRTYLFTDSSSYYNASANNHDRGHNIRGNFRIQWKPDSCNVFDFRPTFSLNFSKSDKDNSSATRAGDPDSSMVNRSTSSYNNDGKSYSFGGQFVYTHKFRHHKGRSYSGMLGFNYSRTNEDGTTFTQNTYYRRGTEETIDQTYENLRTTNTFRGRFAWTEPIGNYKNGRVLTFAYNGTYKFSTANKTVYDINRDSVGNAPSYYSGDLLWSLLHNGDIRDYFGEKYGSYVLTDGNIMSQLLESELGEAISRTYNEEQSNQFNNYYYNQSLEIGFRQIRKTYNLNVGFTVNSAMSESKNLLNADKTMAARWAWSAAPFVRFRYRFSKTRNLAIDYRMNASQPSLTQLQPVAEMSNPLSITIGNPDLKAAFTHRLNLRYNDFSQRAQRSFMVLLTGNFTQNSIISKVTTNKTTGARTTTYDNVSGVWDASVTNIFSLPFTSSKVMFFTNHLYSRFVVRKAYSNLKLNRSQTFSINLAPGIAFRNSEFDLELRPRYYFQTIYNTVSTNSNKSIHTYGGQFNGTYNAPFGLVISTDVKYTATAGYAYGYNTKQWIWNASIGYQFLRGKAASIQVSVYDILNQKQAISRNSTASYIEDVLSNTISRFAMFSFTYRFTTFAKGKRPKAQTW